MPFHSLGINLKFREISTELFEPDRFGGCIRCHIRSLVIEALLVARFVLVVVPSLTTACVSDSRQTMRMRIAERFFTHEFVNVA
jgi:hypothetical protein